MGSRVWCQAETKKEKEKEKENIMASRSGGTPIRTNKVKPGPDQAFTLPKGTSAAPIKNVPVKPKAKIKPKKIKAKVKPKPKPKSEPKKVITKTKTKKNPNPRKRKTKIGLSKPSTIGGVIGAGGTAAALVAIGRSKDKYRKYRK